MLERAIFIHHLENVEPNFFLSGKKYSKIPNSKKNHKNAYKWINDNSSTILGNNYYYKIPTSYKRKK
jgi:hypothetical protein